MAVNINTSILRNRSPTPLPSQGVLSLSCTTLYQVSEGKKKEKENSKMKRKFRENEMKNKTFK